MNTLNLKYEKKLELLIEISKDRLLSYWRRQPRHLVKSSFIISRNLSLTLQILHL